MKRKKQYCVAILVALSVGMFMQSEIAFAASTDEPEFGNSAEALRAANQARDFVSGSSNLKESLSNVEKAQISVNKAVKSGDPNAVTTTSLALEKAVESYMRELASVSGVIETDILSMRDSGMEWRQVGHELGIHSGMLGFGHGGEKSNQIGGVDALELNEATAINPNNGWSQGHGMNIQSGVNHSGSGFVGMNKWNGNNSGEIAGAGGIQHGNSSGSTWGWNGNSNTNDNNMNMNNNMNDNHDMNMNNNMNDNHDNNMNNNMNDNHDNNMNNNMNDNHNNNSNNNMNDNHNSNRSGNSGGGGWGGNSGSRGGGRW